MCVCVGGGVRVCVCGGRSVRVWVCVCVCVCVVCACVCKHWLVRSETIFVDKNSETRNEGYKRNPQPPKSVYKTKRKH